MLTRDEAALRARLMVDVTYGIDLDLTDGGETFGSRTVMRFGCSEPGVSTFVDLTATSVELAELNGVALGADAFTGDRLMLPALAEHNELVVHARAAYTRTSVGLHRFVDPADGCVYLHTQFEPFDAHRVFACFDQPDLKAEFTLSVRAPASWVVASNGAETSRPDGDATRWTFAPMPRISTYLVAVVAGHYEVVRDAHGDVPLALYCRRSLSSYLDADDIFRITRQGLDFFGELFGVPYPFGKYDQLFCPEFRSGAMENPGCITFNEGYVFRSTITEAMREGRAGTILHEMAHMWFGDLVTMRWWDDLWLNESFATYMATRAVAEATRFQQGWARFASGTKASAYRQDQLPSTHPIAADITDTDALRQHFDGITYAKGASVLRQLAAWVGRDAFDDGLRDYFTRYSFDNADLADFLGALEKPSGRALGAWSSEWLETAGVNTMRAEVAVEDGRFASFVITQTAVAAYPTLRSHRVRLGLYADGPDGLVRAFQVELDVSGPSTDVPELVGLAVPDLVVLNDDDLSYAKVRLDDHSLRTVVDRVGDIVDPLARGLCWAASWDMVRDAEMSARQFAEMVADHAHREPDLASRQRLFGLAGSAINDFADPPRRTAVRARLAAQALALLESAPPGGDDQLTWARTWLGFVDDARGFELAASLLDGSRELDGLAIDLDLRWAIVGALTVRGGAGRALIDAELERDATDIGRRRAAGLRSALPTEQAKAAAWAVLLDDCSLPLATKRAIAGGFHQSDQDALLRPYVAGYIDALPRIWAGFDTDEAMVLTGGLFPHSVVEEDTVAAIDAALARPDIGPVARRTLLEGADGLRRALRAQAFDRAAGDLVAENRSR